MKKSGLDSREHYLLDPGRSISLGARWFSDELLKRYKKYGERDMLFAIMDHNAGSPAVKTWLKNWGRQKRADDIEYMIENIRFGQTRIFTRRVLADIILVEASGMFEK